jgi:hypothetical protein
MTIDESARRLGHLRWLEERLFEVLGGWVQTTAETEPKLAFARHSYHHAWHAELLERCLPDTRDHDPEALTAPAGDDWRNAIDALRAVDSTPARVIGVYGAIVPALIDAYERFRSQASPVRDAAAIRWVGIVLADVQADAAEAAHMLRWARDHPDGAAGAALGKGIRFPEP